MTNVTRYEYNRTKGWKVRAKGYPQRLFSDGRYGGKVEAYRAAVEHLLSLPVEARTRARFHRRHGRNKSGVIGVSKIVGRSGKTRGWRVVWCEPPGCVQGRDFLVSRLGTSEVAKRHAVAFRKQVVNDLRPAPEPAQARNTAPTFARPGGSPRAGRKVSAAGKGQPAPRRATGAV